jgi:hypothetical protein
VLRRVPRRLWQGKVTSTIQLLEYRRSKTQDPEALDRFSAYLQARQAWIPNYRQRRLDLSGSLKLSITALPLTSIGRLIGQTAADELSDPDRCHLSLE